MEYTCWTYYKSALITLVSALSLLVMLHEAAALKRYKDTRTDIPRWIEEAIGNQLPKEKYVTKMNQARDYLLKYGYYGESMTKETLESLPVYLQKSLTKKAMITLQHMMGMPESGDLDSMTSKMMSVPRCGLTDVGAIKRMRDEDDEPEGKLRRRKRYVLQGSQWSRRRFPLTYRVVSTTDKLDAQAQVQVFRDALKMWSDVGDISFREVTSGRSTMDISFAVGDHNDPNDFDGRGQVLAHAYYPGLSRLSGDAHFDDAEPWVIRERRGRDLVAVAVHEFGHSLGLDHSTVPGAVMWPTAQPFQDPFTLHEDDIAGIQALYGPSEKFISQSEADARAESGRTEICEGTAGEATVDAVVLTPDNYTAVFKGVLAYRLQTSGGGVAAGYPRLISDEYVGYPPDTAVTAALVVRGRLVLFTPQGVFYRVDGDGIVQGGSIAQSDIGMPDNVTITAALDFQIFRKAYLFTESGEYYRYSTNTGAMDPGYPAQTADVWQGLPATGRLTAATMWTNGRIYFFYSPDDYYRFDIRRGAVPASGGYPRSTRQAWLGC